MNSRWRWAGTGVLCGTGASIRPFLLLFLLAACAAPGPSALDDSGSPATDDSAADTPSDDTAADTASSACPTLLDAVADATVTVDWSAYMPTERGAGVFVYDADVATTQGLACEDGLVQSAMIAGSGQPRAESSVDIDLSGFSGKTLLVGVDGAGFLAPIEASGATTLTLE